MIMTLLSRHMNSNVAVAFIDVYKQLHALLVAMPAFLLSYGIFFCLYSLGTVSKKRSTILIAKHHVKDEKYSCPVLKSKVRF